MAVTPHSIGIVRSGDREPTPWKNGQGATREIARRLLGVRGPHFVWRLSVSDIHADADFGAFPGVQRSRGVDAFRRCGNFGHRRDRRERIGGPELCSKAIHELTRPAHPRRAT